MLKQIFLLGVLSLMVACSKTNSANVKTGGIYVSYTVEGNNLNSAVCRATFQVGGPTGTYLELDSGDVVTCQGMPMARSEFLGIVNYATSVPYSPGGVYSLQFSRPNESAYISNVSLPLPIVGMSPASFLSFRKESGLSVLWTPSLWPLDEMSATLSYNTGQSSRSATKTDSIPEHGSLGFSTYETQSNPPTPGNWSGTLTYSRSRPGSLSLGLSGTIRGQQSFEIPVQLTD